MKLIDARSVLLEDGISEKKVKEAFRTFSDNVNSLTFDPEVMVTEQMRDADDRALAIHLAFMWITFWGADNAAYDGRNRIAVLMCRKILHNPHFSAAEAYYVDPGTPFSEAANCFVRESVCEHRSLLQIETGVMFYILQMFRGDHIQAIASDMKTIYGNDWYYLPLI